MQPEQRRKWKKPKLIIDLKVSLSDHVIMRVGYKLAVRDRQCGTLNWGGLWCLKRVSDCPAGGGGVQRERGSRFLNLIPSPAASWQVRAEDERPLTEFH